MEDLIRKALIPYKLGNESLVVEKVLHETSWNKDLHYKIVADGKPFSARFIGYNRSPNEAFGEISDEILVEQTRFCRYLVKNHIPFMRLFPVSEECSFTSIKWENEMYRFLLFEWMDGQHLTHCDVHIAEEFGQLSRRFHDISNRFTSTVFPKRSHLVGYTQFVEELRLTMNSTNVPTGSLQMVEEYLNLVEHHIERARKEQLDFIIQSDLNPLNVIWDQNITVIGIVDFESIGYTDRIEGLAWLIKWYSRTAGIDSFEMSPDVAKAFLKGYQWSDFEASNDVDRLSSLIWLSGCINWNFIKNTIKILETGHEETLRKHIDAYKLRGEKLYSLIRTI
jgi:hypothetical protein